MRTQKLKAEIQTYSGEMIDLFNPNPSQIKIEDIAHGLANTCRWNGQTKSFYSVAQHCCMMSDISPNDLKLTSLMHDAEEAYFGDIVKPLKNVLEKLFPELVDYMESFRQMIFAVYDVPPMSEHVHNLDYELLVWESLTIMESSAHVCWEPHVAKTEFIKRFNLLTFHPMPVDPRFTAIQINNEK